MNSFRTELKVTPSPLKIELSDPVFTIGSCFSDSIGAFLHQNKFITASNPLGTIYSPVAIFKLLDIVLKNDLPSEDRFVENKGLWTHYDFHSKFSNTSKIALQENLKESLRTAHHNLINARHLFITLGTSWVFERRDSGELVANCHKMPAVNFEKQLLSVDFIVKSFGEMLARLVEINPDINILITVSPVRHLKDTLELNNVSKSVLVIAAHEIVQQFNRAQYFPAYEIMNDDLRDYRFYESDMIHPSTLAIEYICDKFAAKYFTEETREFIATWTSVAAALVHRPFHPSSYQYRTFLEETLKRVEELKSKVCVDDEIKQIKSRLADLSL